jgi:site-specific DNA recombinase
MASPPGRDLPAQSGALAEALADEALRDEAIALLRALLDKIVVVPEGEALRVEIHGELAGILALGLNAKQAALPKEAACSVTVVAGAGFEPATFRL